jgi:hypothetical protein
MMTPGFAKSRKELFWLPYPEPDKVIINAHNFQSAWTPAVNGKTPISAWVPSRDTAGNGTATLNDLSTGGNNGTLTNMDPASDWVSDTDSGGVRALDFDGANDYVVLPINLGGRSKLTVSMWVKSNSSPSTYFSYSANGQDNNDILLYATSTLIGIQVNNGSDGGGTVAYTPSASLWRHIVFVFDGTLTGAANRLKLFVNASQQTLSFSYTPPATTASPTSAQCNMARYHAFPAGFFMSGRQDDLRIWFDALETVDVSALYASGAGRGIQA